MRMRHGTMTAGIVESVALDADFREIEVLNRSAGEIYFTVDGPDPVVGGDDTWVLPPGSARELASRSSGDTVVKLIAVDGGAYSVTGL